MADLLSLDEARQTLRRLTVIAIEANRTLNDSMTNPHLPPTPEQTSVRLRILDELVKMREGFLLALKTSDFRLTSELQDLLTLLVDWTWLQELGLRWETDGPLEKVGSQVILYQHALIALGVLPRLPAQAVTYPRSATNPYFADYHDITAPGSPGATLDRLDELEKTMYRAANEALIRLPGPSVRRTYGFFEATTWLTTTHLRGIVRW
jgi:hypothetical protein